MGAVEAVSTLWTWFTRVQSFAGPIAALLYPLYCSVKAIESPSKVDDQQWLTYWVLYSFITLFELAAGEFLAWIPIWPSAKLVFICWLVLPQFKGATFVYENYVRQYIIHAFNIETNAEQRQLLKSARDTGKKSVTFNDYAGSPRPKTKTFSSVFKR